MRLRHSWSVRTWLIVGTAGLFGLRLLLSAIRTGPVLVADEIGYLTNARAIVGGVAGQLELAPFYRGGYSLLLAPLVEIGASPIFTYHLILALNAALAASLFPLLYALLTRFAALPRTAALWAALAGALYPAVTVLSQVAMSENALFPLVCLWLLAFGGLLAARPGREQAAWAAGVGAVTGALWAVHNRMVVAVALTLVVLVWLAVRRRLPATTLAVALTPIFAIAIGSDALDGFLLDRGYGGSGSEEISTRASELFTAGGLRTALANLVGQSWYLLVATFGLAAAAAFGYGRTRGRPGEDSSRSRTPVIGLLLALAALLLLISAAAFPERTRPDMLIYGRYAEVVAPALVAFGLAALLRLPRAGRLAPAAIGFALLTGVVSIVRATASDPDAANRWNVSALPFVTVQLGPPILIGAALVAAAGALLLLRASSLGPRPLGGVAIALFLAVTLYGAWNPVRSSQRAVYPAGWTSPEPLVAGEAVAYDLDSYDTIGLYVVQWYLPETRLALFEGGREEPPAELVIGDGEWGREQDPPAQLLWRDPGRDQALWRLPR